MTESAIRLHYDQIETNPHFDIIFTKYFNIILSRLPLPGHPFP
jgi:hypothetical protein